MHKFLLFTATLILSTTSFAQTMKMDEIKTDEESTTTIEIKKGRPGSAPAAKPGEPLWEITDGSADLEGEPAATAKDARSTWKKSCEDWKKEFRTDNKENKILAINCGTASCGGDAGSKTCTSKATYKIKTRLN